MDIEIRILKRWDSFQKDIRGIPLRPYVRKSREGRLGCARGASCAFCQPTRSPSRIPDLSRSWRLRLWDVRRMFISHHFTSFISHHFTKVFNNWRPPLMACSACIACFCARETPAPFRAKPTVPATKSPDASAMAFISSRASPS